MLDPTTMDFVLTAGGFVVGGVSALTAYKAYINNKCKDSESTSNKLTKVLTLMEGVREDVADTRIDVKDIYTNLNEKNGDILIMKKDIEQVKKELGVHGRRLEKLETEHIQNHPVIHPSAR